MPLHQKLKQYWSSPSPAWLQRVANNLFPVICYLSAFAVGGFLLFLIPYLTRGAISPMWRLDTSFFAVIRFGIGGIIGLLLFHRWYRRAKTEKYEKE